MSQAIVATGRPPGQARESDPTSICVLRLSAIGDVVQAVPTVRALQRRFPDAAITWIVGRREAELVGELDGVEVVPFDKKPLLASAARLRRHFAGRRFDVLLHMHPSMRANIASLALRARRRVGYDRARTNELQRLFVNERLPTRDGGHVLESFLDFAHHLGAEEQPPRWDLPIREADRAFARTHLPGDRPYLIVSACSSTPTRDWHPAGYAEVARHAIDRLGMGVVLCGGPGAREVEVGKDIEKALEGRPVVNLIGRDTLRQLLAVLERATVLISPDSGPAHMASAVGTPVVGVFAASDPARSGPYSSLEWCVNRFDAAAREFLGRPAAELPWRTRIEKPGVMNLIEPPDVIERLEAVMAWKAGDSNAATPNASGSNTGERSQAEAQSADVPEDPEP